MDVIDAATSPEELSDLEREIASPLSIRATFGWSAVVGVVALVSQFVFIIVWAIVAMLIGGVAAGTESIKDANAVLGAGIFSYPFVVGAMYLIIRSRRGLSFAPYVGWQGWRALRVGTLIRWIAALFGTMFFSGVLMVVSGAEKSELMGELIQTSNPILVISMMVFGAPLIEELFFRGFMFRGLQNSQLGGVGAVVITTLVWALIHGGQYNFAEVSCLVVLGTLLGHARLKTGSICLPIILHAINNLIGVVAAYSLGAS